MASQLYLKACDYINQRAVETINRLGAAAQDCMSCAKQGKCDGNCDYEWYFSDPAHVVELMEKMKDEH